MRRFTTSEKGLWKIKAFLRLPELSPFKTGLSLRKAVSYPVPCNFFVCTLMKMLFASVNNSMAESQNLIWLRDTSKLHSCNR